MRLPPIFGMTASVLLLLSSTMGYAEETAVTPTHEHGVASLSIANHADGLEIILRSPAQNLAGFEYKPSTDEDKLKLKDVTETLEKGDELFTLNPEAGCELKDTEVLATQLGDSLDEAAQDEPQMPTSNTTSDDATPNPNAHNDMEVTWAYVCNAPAELTSITSNLFGTFPDGFTRIEVDWATDQAQANLSLDQDAAILLQ